MCGHIFLNEDGDIIPQSGKEKHIPDQHEDRNFENKFRKLQLIPSQFILMNNDMIDNTLTIITNNKLQKNPSNTKHTNPLNRRDRWTLHTGIEREREIEP